MGGLQSHPNISIKYCQSKKDIVRAMKLINQPIGNNNDLLIGVPEFVVSNEALHTLIRVDLKKPKRQSENDYIQRIRNKIACQFASAPNELSIVYLIDDNTGEVLSLLRIESANKTKEVTLSILKPRPPPIPSSFTTSSNIQTSQHKELPHYIYKEFVNKVCSRLRSFPYNKKRIRSEIGEHDETLLVSCGFQRLKTQDSIKFYNEIGHPKRVISLERKLMRWDDVKYIFMLKFLIKEHRAFSLIETLSSSSSLLTSSSPNTLNISSSSSNSSKLYCLHKLLLAAAEQPCGDFYTNFLLQVMKFIYN